MRFEFRVVLIAVAANASLAFAPNAKPSPAKSTELNVLSHYSRLKPDFHPDARTNMNNFQIDEFSGLSYEEAEQRREQSYMKNQLLAEEIRREQDAIELARIQAEEEAWQRAAEERAAIREADEAEARAIAEAEEAARQKVADEIAQMKAEQEQEEYHFAQAAQAAEEEEREMTPEEKASAWMKSQLSDEDIKKMAGLRGWRRMQFMDNSLDGNIIKRFPRKHPDHPDSRTNNKHTDLNEYVELTMEEYEAYREEARLEARRQMGAGKALMAQREAAAADQRLASVQRGQRLMETKHRVYDEEANNRVFMRRY